MPYLYLIISVFMIASASVFVKIFNKQHEGEKDFSKLYNFIMLAFVFATWALLFAFDFSFNLNVLPYALLFAICYTVCNIGVINSLKHGPATLTSLFTTLSLIVSTIWGFFFWNSEPTPIVIVGLIIVVVAIYLCLYTGKKSEKKISVKWLIFVLMAFFGNAGCTIVQRTQQMNFNGQHGNMLMAFATFFSLIASAVMFFIGNKDDSKTAIKKSLYLPAIAGVCNVALNFFVILLATSSLSPSLIYPVLGVGGLAVVSLFSVFAFKEKLLWQQWLGMFLGAVATVLLSL